MLKHSYRFDESSGIGKLAEIFKTQALEDSIKIINDEDFFAKYDDMEKITNFKQLKTTCLHKNNYGCI